MQHNGFDQDSEYDCNRERNHEHNSSQNVPDTGRSYLHPRIQSTDYEEHANLPRW